MKIVHLFVSCGSEADVHIAAHPTGRLEGILYPYAVNNIFYHKINKNT